LKFTLESSSAVAVRSVANGQFLIGDRIWSEPIALTPTGVLESWAAPSVENLSIESLGTLLDLGPELMIVGTGSQQLLPNRDLMFAMARSGVGLEIMDTPACARTFNVLLAEGRSVAAVLYPTEKS
jgi:uncharacterized protein